jgi:hypothetical protein
MMARYTKAKLNGKEIYLAYTVSAMFQINDMLEDGQDLLSVLSGGNEKELERCCEAICILARSGAKARTMEGYEASYAPTKEELLTCMLPIEYMQIKKEAVNAILLGYGREIADPNEEVDMELAELEKKQSPPEQAS